MSVSSFSTSSRRSRRYKVLLSFRGEDTRRTFVSHLYSALVGRRIETFIDNEGIDRGSEIRETLEEEIKRARIALVVLSKNFSNSSWCLYELLRIMDCCRENGLLVYPIFYDVSPSDVRNQTGDFGKQFALHNNAAKVKLWRRALVEVAGLAGWDLNDSSQSDEASYIKAIVETVLRKLGHLPKSIDKNLIGLDRRTQSMMPLSSGEHDVGIIGILGLPGSGKTTVARAVYSEMCQQFDGHSFVEDISEVSKNDGLVCLQNQILSSVLGDGMVRASGKHDGCKKIKEWLSQKKVLIVLDKVDSREQLEALAGARDWFGCGSRIIITTNDERLLVAHKLVDNTYNVILLDDEEALQLFSQHAFKDDCPTEAHKEPLERVIRYAAGHPGAIKCLASKLIGKPIRQWKNTLDSLEKCLEPEINNMLGSSLDGLNDLEKESFLDIACFFHGYVKDDVIDILDSCGLFATSGLTTLKEKNLINFSGEIVHVHNLVQEMGRNIVRLEYPGEPSRQSRWWIPEEVRDILEENEGTEDIRAIVISSIHKLDARGAFDAFIIMKNLRLLHANTQNMVFPGVGSSDQWIIQGSGCLRHLNCGIRWPFSFERQCNLRWLTWDHFNLKSWPIDFHPKKLVGLQMRHSSIVELCSSRDVKFLGKLQILDLSFSKGLIRTPNFGCMPDLKKLNLEFCSSLAQVHPSIGVHSRLVHLNLRSCAKLESLPSNVNMKSLEVLNLSGCSNLTNIPEFINMDNLSELDLSRNSVYELPSTIGDLPSLKYLDISNCRNLTCLPKTIKTHVEIVYDGCPNLYNDGII